MLQNRNSLMPPKSTSTKVRSSSAGSTKDKEGKKKNSKKKSAVTGPSEPSPPTLEEMINNVVVAKPFAGVLSDTGSAMYSVAVAEMPSQPTSGATPVVPTKLVLAGSHNGIISVSQCAVRPSSNQRIVGSSDFRASHDFEGSGSPFASPTAPPLPADANGRPPFDSTQAAAGVGLGNTLLLPQCGAAPLYAIKTQSLPAHKNIVKQLLVCNDLRAVVGKNVTSHTHMLPPLPQDVVDGVPVSHPMLFSCSVDGTIKLWSLPDCTLKGIYTTEGAQQAAARAVAAPTLGQTAVEKARAALGDQVSKTTTFLTSVTGDSPTRNGATGGKTVASENEVTTTGNRPIDDLHRKKTSTFNAMCLGPDGSNKLYACDDEGFVHCWEIIPASATSSTQNRTGPSPQSPSTTDEGVQDTFLPITSLRVHRGRVTALCVPFVDPLLFPEGPHNGMPDLPPPSSSIITVSDEGIGKLVNLATKKVVAIYVCESAGETQYAPTEPATSVCYRHPNVIIGCMDGSIQVFDSATAKRVAKWQGHADSVNRLLLTKPYATGPTTAVPPPPPVKVYSKKQQQKMAMAGTPIPPPAPPPVHTQLPVEAHLLLSCSDDRSIALWDCTSWTPVFYFTTPSASLSRFRRPPSARFQSTAAGGTGDGFPLPTHLSSQSGSIDAIGSGSDPLVFGHRTAASSPNAAALYHKHSITDLALDPATLSEFTLSMLQAVNAAGAGTSSPAKTPGSKPYYSAGSSPPATGSQLSPVPRGGGGILFSVCFGGKVLMWNYQSIVGSLDQRQRIQYNSNVAAKAKARAEALAEKNKQNQRGSSAKGRK